MQLQFEKFLFLGFLVAKNTISATHSVSATTRQPAISALPFLISCFVVVVFYLARSIHSPNPFLSLLPSLLLSLRRLPHGTGVGGGHEAGGLERACYYNVGVDGESCKVFYLK